MKKIDKQYAKLREKGINVSYQKFKEYYEVSRKAKAKLNRLNRTRDTNNLLRNRTISNEIDFISDKKEFDKALNRRKKIVSKKFIEEDNKKARNEISKNIHKAFGYNKRVKYLISALNKMSIRNLKKFMNENKDIYAVLWYADQDLIDKLDFKLKDFEERVKMFDSSLLKKNKITIDDNISGFRIKKPKAKKKKNIKKNIYEENLDVIRKLNPELFK